MLEITRHNVPIAGLPDALHGLRVAQISDLHRDKITNDVLLHRAVAHVNGEKPDLILLTGDYVTQHAHDIAPCMRLLEPLHAPLGCVAVLGNHDYNAGAEAVACGLQRLGVRVLTNAGLRLENGLCLVGLEDSRYGKPDPSLAFADMAAEEPALVLAHNPAMAELVADRDCVVFSGHTHGGQVRLPILTRRELRRIGAKHYRHGWYTVGKARLYVNRGLGNCGVPFRFAARPEISVFTLQAAR